MDSPTSAKENLQTVDLQPPEGPRRTAMIVVRQMMPEKIIFESYDPLPTQTQFVYHLRAHDGVTLSLLYEVHECKPSAPRRWCVEAQLLNLGDGDQPLAQLRKLHAVQGTEPNGPDHRFAA